MNQRSVLAGATLLAGVLVLVLMGIVGYNAATAPIEDEPVAEQAGPTCAPEDQITVEFVRRNEVTVSVYNSGTRVGRAQATLDQLADKGFRPGAIGNAPDELATDKAVVYTTEADDAAAELVARAFGKPGKIEIVHTDEEYGPGVDVVIGDGFEKLRKKSAKKIKLPEPVVSCADDAAS